MRSFLAIVCAFVCVCMSWSEARVLSQDLQVSDGIDKIFFIYPHKKSFADALALCKQFNLDLLTIESDEETDQLTLEVVTTHFDETFWTSGSLNSDNKWVWKSTNEPITYAHWGDEQPSDDPNKKCVIFTQDDLEGGWANVDCKEEHIPICQSKPRK